MMKQPKTDCDISEVEHIRTDEKLTMVPLCEHCIRTIEDDKEVWHKFWHDSIKQSFIECRRRDNVKRGYRGDGL